jgi:putative tricarboxylic transport membrane protein
MTGGKTVKRAWQIACLAFAVFAVLTLALSTQYAYRDRLGPGPAFFPVWMSIITAVLSLALLVQTTMGHVVTSDSASLLPDRPGASRILAILAALVGSVALLDPLGFRLSLFLFLVFLPPALGARGWWFTLVFALAGSFGVFHVFYYWLKVPLPVGLLGL